MNAAANVLLAEDDPEVRETLADALSEAGHAVLAVKNGSEALDLLDRIGRPVLLVLDLNMPVMDGVTVLFRLKDQLKADKIEVVVMSGAVDPEWFRGAPGVVKRLRKPFDPRELLVVANEFAARHFSGSTATGQPGSSVVAVTPDHVDP